MSTYSPGGRRGSILSVQAFFSSPHFFYNCKEAAAYSGIGINKLRELTHDANCQSALWVGNKRLIKRRLFDLYIKRMFSI